MIASSAFNSVIQFFVFDCAQKFVGVLNGR